MHEDHIAPSSNPKATTATDTRSTRPTQPPSATPSVLYCPFPKSMCRRRYAIWFAGAYLCIFIALMFAALALIVRSPAFLPGAIQLILVMLSVSLPLSIIGTLIYQMEEKASTRWVMTRPPNSPRFTRCFRICRTILRQKYPAGPPRKLDPRQAPLLRRAVGPNVRTIADARFEEELKGIKIPPHLRDPERIDSGLSIPPIIGWIWILFLPYLVYRGCTQRDWITLLLLVVCLQNIYGIRAVRSQFRKYIGLPTRCPIIAPGVLVNRRNHRWTIDDSILLINSGPNRIIIITLLNSTNRAQLQFHKLDHPDFITLWQNWNHPNHDPNS